MSASRIVYVSGLKAGTSPYGICQNLCQPAHVAEVISEFITHGDNALFVVFTSTQSAQTPVQTFAGKSVYEG